MIGRLFDGVPRRGVALLATLLVVLLAAPWMANDYLLTVLIIILYSAYTGQAWPRESWPAKPIITFHAWPV